MQHLTVRHDLPELTRRLRALAEERGESVNSTVVSILSTALGIGGRGERLARYATWTPEDVAEFEAATQLFEQIDQAMWR